MTSHCQCVCVCVFVFVFVFVCYCSSAFFLSWWGAEIVLSREPSGFQICCCFATLMKSKRVNSYRGQSSQNFSGPSTTSRNDIEFFSRIYLFKQGVSSPADKGEHQTATEDSGDQDNPLYTFVVAHLLPFIHLVGKPYTTLFLLLWGSFFLAKEKRATEGKIR